MKDSQSEVGSGRAEQSSPLDSGYITTNYRSKRTLETSSTNVGMCTKESISA